MPQRGRPFGPGNTFGRGRPCGSRNKRSRKAHDLLDTYSESLLKKAALEALKGDTRLLQTFLGYILPRPSTLPVRIGTVGTDTPAELAQASGKVVKQVAAGKITPSEGEQLSSVIENHLRLLEMEGLDKRGAGAPFEVHIQKEQPAEKEPSCEESD